jgi:hypothetical protein
MRVPSSLLGISLICTALTGCVVAPVAPPPRPRPVVVAPAPVIIAPSPPPANVVYVAPTYVIPGPGYVWSYHARDGWGWHHPQYGWHLGWR